MVRNRFSKVDVTNRLHLAVSGCNSLFVVDLMQPPVCYLLFDLLLWFISRSF